MLMSCLPALATCILKHFQQDFLQPTPTHTLMLPTSSAHSVPPTSFGAEQAGDELPTAPRRVVQRGEQCGGRHVEAAVVEEGGPLCGRELQLRVGG